MPSCQEWSSWPLTCTCSKERKTCCCFLCTKLKIINKYHSFQSLWHNNDINVLSFIYSSQQIALLIPSEASHLEVPLLSLPRSGVRVLWCQWVVLPRGLVGELGIVPAATAADISELFIKRMTTLSSPISGPSCTGVLLLLSGRVSSILLPCYSLELLMANTIPPFLPGLSRLAVWNQAWRGGSGR